MTKLCDRVEGVVQVVLVTLLGLLVALSALDLLLWAAFEISVPQLTELSGVALIWLGLLAAAYGVRHGLHLGLELVTDRLPQRLTRRLAPIPALATATFGALLAWYGLALVRAVDNTLPASGLPAAVQYVPAVVAGPLIALFALERLRAAPGSPPAADD